MCIVPCDGDGESREEQENGVVGGFLLTCLGKQRLNVPSPVTPPWMGPRTDVLSGATIDTKRVKYTFFLKVSESASTPNFGHQHQVMTSHIRTKKLNHQVVHLQEQRAEGQYVMFIVDLCQGT